MQAFVEEYGTPEYLRESNLACFGNLFYETTFRAALGRGWVPPRHHGEQQRTDTQIRAFLATLKGKLHESTRKERWEYLAKGKNFHLVTVDAIAEAHAECCPAIPGYTPRPAAARPAVTRPPFGEVFPANGPRVALPLAANQDVKEELRGPGTGLGR